MSKIYFITDGTFIKIGYTGKNVNKRIKQLSTGSSSKLYALGWVKGDKNLEKEWHNKYAYLRKNLEWFKVDDNLLNEINSTNENCVYVDWLNEKLITYKKMKI